MLAETRGFPHCPEIHSSLRADELVPQTAGRVKLENAARIPQIAYLQRKKRKKNDRETLTHTLSPSRPLKWRSSRILLAHSP